jgi:UPF0755 protein
MKDENGRDLPEYDIDKLIAEYTNLTSDKTTESHSAPVPEKKKFVVHIDENLINMSDDDNSKPASGGIYFSNFQKKHSNSSHVTNKPRYGETQSENSKSPNYEKISASIHNAAQQEKSSAVGSKINNFTSKNIERIGGKTAAIFLAVILVSTILLSYLGISCIGDMLAINRSEDVVSVSIPEGSSSSDIIDILKSNGLIKRKGFCKMFTKYRNFDESSYLSGVYYLNAKMGVEGMLKEIMAAPVTADTIKLSFPEGWTTQQIFEKLEKYDVCTSNKLYTAMKTADFSYDFIKNINDSQSRYLKLEGYLFPDTYDFYVDADTNYVIKKFLANFDEKWTDEYDARAKKLGYSMDEIITVASIVQKEAANASQMKTIASIIYNRLADPANYPTLGCDSTAIYISNYVTPIVGEAQGSFYYSKYDSSAIKGLPPGPICNPGIDAIKAALYPADTKYYYFAHDNTGKIYLAETYKEHKNNLVLIIKANNKG